jgi:hypothetical protein
MKTSNKVLCFSSLAIAGVLSILLSFFGLFGLAWGGFPKSGYDAQAVELFLPLVLALPLFALAVGVTKYASLVLWIMVAISWIVMIRISMSNFHGGPLDFLTLLVVSLFRSFPMLLLLLAALVEFCTHFYEFTRDRSWVRWKGAEHQPAA